jgi:hypothetical protein
VQSTPREIGDKTLLYWSLIDARHRKTGACRHFNLSTNLEDPYPSSIAIVKEGNDSFLLMRFAEDWQFITDTWHESLEEAFGQAEFEFEGVSKTWQMGDGTNE